MDNACLDLCSVPAAISSKAEDQAALQVAQLIVAARQPSSYSSKATMIVASCKAAHGSPVQHMESVLFWLQDRVRNLEKELDWVGAELSDARKGAQRAAREATGRVCGLSCS